MSYVELHCHSNFSLLDGASSAEMLAQRASELGMPALAVTDHDGLYGVVRFARACQARGVKPIIGAELTVDGGHHITLLARNNSGYSNLCRLVSTAQLEHTKGQAQTSFATLAEHSANLICLSGCRLGEVPSHLLTGRPSEALSTARQYVEVFGRERYWIELQNHRRPEDRTLCAELATLARRLGIGCVATNDVHYATRVYRRLQDVLVCIRTRTTLSQPHPLRRPNSEYYLKDDAQMQALFGQNGNDAWPDDLRRVAREAIANTACIDADCSVELDFTAYRFPQADLPSGETPFSYLYALCHRGLGGRYRPVTPEALAQLSHELSVIEKLGLAEYFLVVWDIVRFARSQGILAQGRGSAANSIVAYCLGITNVDPIELGLLFERFLSEERAGSPDIDIDFANSRREEVIQYVYQKYGAEHTAMVCSVITFQARSAVRDVARTLGMPRSLIDRIARSLEHRSADRIEEGLALSPEFDGLAETEEYRHLLDLCRQIDGYPRHLSIHVGGMLITSRPLVELVPLERATMPGRVVCQYDKDDVEEIGLVKIDLLGLGMLALIQDCLELVEKHRGARPALGQLSLDDPQVYDMLCLGDTVGVFQVESRAQMATLPRLRPRTFYDIVIQIAIIRPGPIQGQMVHPFLQRRQGREPVSYLHPSLEPILGKTLGVPLFQEQVIRIATVAAGFTPGQADLLRRAMSSHRSRQEMDRLRGRFIDGAIGRGFDQETAEKLFQQLAGFAGYGFPESHAAAFARIVYDSAYLKLYYAPEFYCALLNNQPMGFYHPSVIVGDARRHGVPVWPVDANRSRANCTVEDIPDAEGGSNTGQAKGVRLGFRYVRGIGEESLAGLDAAEEDGPYRSLRDFCERTELDQSAIQNLTAVGAFDWLGIPRRELLWQLPTTIGAARAGRLPGLEGSRPSIDLPAFTAVDEARADYYALGLSTGHHLVEFHRTRLDRQGVRRAAELADLSSGTKVRVAGLVVCRQAPPTAKGHVFLTMEDETGLFNVIVRPDVYHTYRQATRQEILLVIEGTVQNQDGVVNLLARRITPLRPGSVTGPPARSFH